MTKFDRVETIAFDPGRRQKNGIEVSVRFSAPVFNKVLEVKRQTGARSLKEVFHAALDKHVETLRLLQEGYRIFAAPADFTASNAVEITPELVSVDAAEVDEIHVVTEVQIGFSAEELRLIQEIQEMLSLGTGDTTTPVVQAVMAYFWMIDKQQKGFPSIHAVKEAPARCTELEFDRHSCLIKRG